ncbi:MAG: DUF4139 domain-containing protein [Kordiimonadaceae bacterium]|nr:DUF4139 domain-containing protein [Kordiimonadaceae bacterium]MBO6570104.1 DUF4139 domain-containing protein [Kordiimonadaceae bacterium]MBO6965798.1 DUF4139 domain-containing protein [Kordiimonadaceae bacterium]
MKLVQLSGVAATLAALMASTSVIAEDFVPDAPITGVKIHRNFGAIVTRSFSLNLPIGQHRIKISDLTDQLNEDYALRASVVSGNAAINQVQLDEVFLPNVGREAQANLLAQLESLETAQSNDRTAIEAITMQLSFIQGMAKEATKSGDYSSPADLMEALQQTFDFVKANSGSLLNERQSLESAMKDRADQIKVLKRELSQLGGTRESVMEGTLVVSSSASAPVTIAVNYLVEDATWDIDAEANLNTASNETELKLFARVSQETDEDWNNVPVALSTTRPSNNISVNSPVPVYFNLEDAGKAIAGLLDKVRSGRITESARLEEIVVTGSRLKQYNSSQFDAEFELSGTISLAADGSEQRFLLQEHAAKSDHTIRVVPQSSRSGFIYANAAFDGIPFIEAPYVSIARDNNFVGNGAWPTLQSGKNLQLPFGVDTKIDVEVVTVPSEDGDEGIFNRKQVDETKRRFIVTNNHDVAMTIEVLDTRPNSMNEDLEIELLRGSTRTTETDYDDQPGIVMWRKTVAPGEKWEINHWYRVSFPTDMSVVQQ